MSDQTPERGVDAPAVALISASSTRTCGDFGGRTIAGQPCAQNLGPDPGRTRCAFHPDLPPEGIAAVRAELARKAGIAARTPHRAPGSAPDPDFSAPPKIIRWAEKTAGGVLRGELTDYKGLEATLKLARLALDALGIQALDQLDKLEALIRGRLTGAGGAP